MAEFASLLAMMDPDAGLRGREFERVCKWYLTHDPVYRREVKRVWLWDEWPNRWAADAGIDLVAETHDGNLWAIQAKVYEPNYYLKKSDIDSFLSESARPVFSYRLLIATTNAIGARTLRTIDGQDKSVGLVLRDHLLAAPVDWPESPSDLRAKPLAKKKPFPHNREAIRAVVRGFADADRGQLVMACGTGKTLVGLWVTEALGCERTLVLVPSLSLLAQTLREWTANASHDFRFLAVCSDQTVVSEDHFTTRTSELGLPVTTNPRDIGAFLRQSGRSVVFATYQSSPAVAEAFRLKARRFDLAIADEAHRCAGPTSGAYATILDQSKIRAARRLFMTATPRYFTERVRKEGIATEYEIASMNDEGQFGRVFHALSFGDAIRRELLSDYQVAVIGVDNDTVRGLAERGRFVTLDGKQVTDARTLASHVGVAKAMRKYDLRRLITFHGRVARARDFSAELPRVISWLPRRQRPSGRLWSAYVSGEMSSGRRDVLLRRFRHIERNERALLSNARCLAEGVDVPSIDGVAFIDPKASQIEIIQAVGRAIRKTAEKKIGTVILPVFVHRTADPGAELDDSAFKPVWAVLKALRAHDDVLGEELDGLRRELGRRSITVRSPGKIHIEMPLSVGTAFADAFELRLVEETSAVWEFWFGLVQRFVEREGHARVPIGHTEDERSLGKWVSAQRALGRRGSLSADRSARLAALPGWTWDPFTLRWQEGLDCLLGYVRRYGHSRPPGKFVENGYALGQWVSVQRRAHTVGYLEAERAAQLEALPGWTWHPDQTEWEEAFARLQAFVDREGHSRVSSRHLEIGFDLGHWVSRQRTAFRSQRLDETKAARLDALPGWEWDLKAVAWDEGLTRLSKFLAQHGSASPASDFVDDDGYRLGSWVAVQRGVYRRGDLEAERVRRLEALRGWQWTPHSDKWEQGFAALQRFVAREGHARPTESQLEDGFALGRWVQVQRKVHDSRTRQLKPDRAQRLEALPGWTWEPLDTQWGEGFEQLEKFLSREGHAVVPRFHVEAGFKLGYWVSGQRVAQARGRLDANRAKRLNAQPGWAWNAEDGAWERAFVKLEKFVAREGHARVPAGHREDGFGLASWVSGQRSLNRRGSLNARRVQRLSELPGWSWHPSSDQWERGFESLQRFVKREGHALVPAGHEEDGFPLRRWVDGRRVAFWRSAKPDPALARRLEALPGWAWRVFDEKWEASLGYLKRFVAREGTARVPIGWMEDGFDLGDWVAIQRAHKKARNFREDRARELEELPGWTWSPYDADWERAFDLLLCYVQREGHRAVPKGHVESGFRLGAWVQNQRQAWKRGDLEASRAKRLSNVAEWSWESQLDRRWEVGLEHLERFVRREGHARVPAPWVEDGFRLGGWVSKQREAFKAGTIGPERVERLEALVGWLWSIQPLKSRGESRKR